MIAPRLVLVVALVSASALAGCVVPEDAERCETYAYVTIHYAELLDEEELRDGFVEAGWEWVAEGPAPNTAAIEPPRALATAVFGVVSLDPGPSGAGPGDELGTIVSIEQSAPLPGGEGRVMDVATAAADVVNATFEPDPRIDQWILGEKTPVC